MVGHARYLLHAVAAAAGLTLLVHPAALMIFRFKLWMVRVGAGAGTAATATHQRISLPQENTSLAALYWLQESVRLTAWVTLATLPLVACYFNQSVLDGAFRKSAVMVPFRGDSFCCRSVCAVRRVGHCFA